MASYTTHEFIGAAAIESLPEMDTLSSYEFWRERQRSSLPQPELTLMMAILEDALKCYFDYAQAKTRTESKLFDEAEQWFFSEDDEALFNFKTVCAFLGIDRSRSRQENGRNYLFG
ncbi:MAG TPA: hypothetical protein VEG60_10175 [Candidatus Binatia bacterium]|nr:hypothetical protein [Candidatus Binatia bacterium]